MVELDTGSAPSYSNPSIRPLWFHTHHNPVKLLADVKPERLAVSQTILLISGSTLPSSSSLTNIGRTNAAWFSTHACRSEGKPPLPISPRNSACIRRFPSIAAVWAFWPETIAKKPAISASHWWASASCIRKAIFGSGSRRKDGKKRPMHPSIETESPIHPALTPAGDPCRFTVEMGGRQVSAVVWKVLVGRVPLYLIDTDVPEKQP